MASIDRLLNVVAKLRAEDGCPWDKEQTHMSLKPECIEEATEVICGINILDQTGNADNLKEELGDLLLQVVMHCQIAQEEGLFSFDEVVDGISDKYKAEVFRFADKIEAFYNACTPKVIPDDTFWKNGYVAFWNEWHSRRSR